jgi:hypothetical protein
VIFDTVLIDCDDCVLRGDGCADCVVTAMLGPIDVAVDPLPSTPGPLTDEERRALRVLADAGLVPPLRLAQGPPAGSLPPDPGRGRCGGRRRHDQPSTARCLSHGLPVTTVPSGSRSFVIPPGVTLWPPPSSAMPSPGGIVGAGDPGPWGESAAVVQPGCAFEVVGRFPARARQLTR